MTKRCAHHTCFVEYLGDECPLCLMLKDTRREKRGITHGFMRESMVDVHIYPAGHPQTVLPKDLMELPVVILNIGYQMAIPIPDLDLGEDGISATLSFGQVPFKVFVHWDSVFGISIAEQKGALWLAAASPQLREDVSKRQVLVGRDGKEDIMDVDEISLDQVGRPVGRFSVMDGGKGEDGGK